MKLALFYDTETTGLPLFREPSEHPNQPHIVQLAACLVDLYNRKTIACMDATVRPDGWTIADDVAAIHGITTEKAQEIGIPESLAVGMFMELWGHRVRIAHNEQFDARILRIALMRHEDNATAEDWSSGTSQCTATMTTPICQIPPTAKMLAAGFKKFKTPNLTEAYQHFIGNSFENAHSAMADVQACMAIYFAMNGEKQ